MLRVGKLDAANRQLDCAIQLLFSGGDPVCIHTLAGAASILFSDLIEHHASQKSWDRAAQKSNRLSPKEYFGIIRKPQNFLKHAKDDPAAIFNFDSEELFFALFSAHTDVPLVPLPLPTLTAGDQVFLRGIFTLAKSSIL